MAFASSSLILAVEWSIRSKRKMDTAKRREENSKLTLRESVVPHYAEGL